MSNIPNNNLTEKKLQKNEKQNNYNKNSLNYDNKMIIYRQFDSDIIKLNKEKDNKNNKNKKATIINQIKLREKNLEIIKLKNKDLQDKLNELINELKNEGNNTLVIMGEYKQKINKLEKEIKQEKTTVKNLYNNLALLNKEISLKYDSLIEKNKYYLNNSPLEKENISEKIEKIQKLKEFQLNSDLKKYLFLKKEISKYKKILLINKNVDENIKKENPKIETKGEELSYILNKNNNQIESLKKYIIFLKNIQIKHNIKCPKIKQRLLKELEFIKIEKKKKLEELDSIKKYMKIEEKRKKEIENNKSKLKTFFYKKLNNTNIDIFKHNIKNSLINNSIQMSNRMKEQKIKIPLAPSLSSDYLTNNSIQYQKGKNQNSFIEIKDNLYEYMKKKIQNNQIKNRKNNYYSLQNSNNNSGILTNIFSEEEKSFLKKYNFIPDKNITDIENKYKTKINNINEIKQKLITENKINNLKKLNIKFQIEYNSKKSNILNMKNREFIQLIKANNNKILKLKDLIKKNGIEENELNLQFKNKELINNKLKEMINLPSDILNSKENEVESIIQNLFINKINIFENFESCNNNDKNSDEKIDKIIKK